MKRTSKLLVLLLSLSLLLGAIVGLSVTASAEDVPTVEIKGKNMSYTGAVQVMYYLKVEGLEAEEIGDRVKLLVSDAPITVVEGDTLPDDVSVKIHRGDLTVAETNYAIFFSDAIAPAELRKPIYAVPVILDAEDATKIAYAGTPSEYSPYTYAINRFSQSPTPDQKALYKALLDYGAAVQDVLLTDDEIAANGGWADQYYNIKINKLVNGTVKTEGDANVYYRPTDVIEAANRLADNEVFAGFTLEDNTTYVTNADRSFVSLNLNVERLTTDPSQKVTLHEHYDTRFGEYENFDSFDAAKQLNTSSATFVTDASAATGGYTTVGTADGNNYFEFGSKKNSGHTASFKNLGFQTGETYVVDTEFSFETNYKYLGSNNDHWLVKLYIIGTNTSGVSKEITNVTVATRDGVTYNVGNATGLTVGEKYNLRIEYTPGEKCIFYVNDQIARNSSAGNDYLLFEYFSINTRGTSNMKTDENTPENVTLSFKTDNTYVGMQSKAVFETSNSNDFEIADGATTPVLDGVTCNKTANINFANGKLNVEPTSGWFSLSFAIDAPVEGVAKGSKYVFESDFSYNGGKIGSASDKNISFVGFSNTTLSGNSTMRLWDYMSYTGASTSGEDAPSVMLYGQTFAKGEAVKIRFEYVVGQETMYIYRNGELVGTKGLSGGDKASTDTEFSSFTIYFRGYGSSGSMGTGLSLSFDNTYCALIAPEESEATIRLAPGDGATVDTKVITQKYGDALPELPTPTKTTANGDSTFAGWYYNNKQYKEGDISKFLSYAPLTAKWYNYNLVTLDATDGTLDVTDPVYAKYGATYTLPVPTAQTAKEFAGWYTVDDKGNLIKSVSSTGVWKYDAATTLKAKWVDENTGRTGHSLYAKDAIDFESVNIDNLSNYFLNTDSVKANFNSAYGGVPGTAGKWTTVIGSVGDKSYNAGHSGSNNNQSTTSQFKLQKTVEDANVEKDTLIIEFDMKFSGANNVYASGYSGWQFKFQFASADLNNTMFLSSDKKFSFNGKYTFESAEDVWYNVRYEFVANEDGNAIINALYINGVKQSSPSINRSIPFAQVERLTIGTRAAVQFVNVEFDNVYVALHKAPVAQDAEN